MTKRNLAVFISGRGSNLRSIIEACKDPQFPARVAFVLSNRPDAGGLDFVRAESIPYEIVDHKVFPDRESFEKAMLQSLLPYNIDLICLAGFMRILTPFFIGKWEGKIINIHPSLLPDYKGLNTHARALADGRQETGCTVHYVVPDMDSGPTILKKTVTIKPGDTEEILAARVLEQEHLAYPEAIQRVLENKSPSD